MSDHLADVVELAVEAARTGGGPFAARIVTPSGEVFDGVNRVTQASDPTAHAEVQAIRAAANGLGTHDLSGAVLYTSTYPCPMCFTAAMWARVERVVYAATAEDASVAGFDDSAFWVTVGSPAMGPMPCVQGEVVDRVGPFVAWAGNPARVPY